MVYKIRDVWIARLEASLISFRILIVFIPYFFPKKHIPCVFPSLVSPRLEASLIIFRIFIVFIPNFLGNSTSHPFRPSLIQQNECTQHIKLRKHITKPLKQPDAPNCRLVVKFHHFPAFHPHTFHIGGTHWRNGDLATNLNRKEYSAHGTNNK